MKYPFKNYSKNILFIFLAILLVGGVFIYAEYKNNKEKSLYTATEITATSSDTETAQNLDSDGDGVPDWEEILMGTDPHNAKSKPSSIKNATTTISKDLTKSTEKLSSIDLVSRDFFARYMDLRQQGISGDKLSQQELVDRTVSSIKLNTAKDYTLEEILVKSDISKEAVKNYGNEMAAVFKKYVVETRNEGIIVKDALLKKDPEILKELDPTIESYKNIVNGLLKIKAPKSIDIMHLDLINAMNSGLFMARSFRQTLIDPFIGASAVSQYLVNEKKFFDALKTIQSYLIYLGITYDSTEPGFFFVHPK